jgi:NAD dependent epimerase/dehydratase family enzyme
MDVRQIVARQYVILTKAASSKRQAPSSKLQAASSKLRRYVTLTQDVVVWLLGYSLKKNVDNLHYFVLFNNGPWYNVILTIKKEK